MYMVGDLALRSGARLQWQILSLKLVPDRPSQVTDSRIPGDYSWHGPRADVITAKTNLQCVLNLTWLHTNYTLI
jgi:hypothetical protein